MRIFLSFLIFSTLLFAEFEFQGKVGVESQAYLLVPDEKNKNNFTSFEELQMSYTYEALKLYTKIYAQQDYYDVVGDKKNERTFGRIDELYALYEFDEDALSIGKNIRFWGALEVKNIVDGFNPQDFRNDIFTTDKLGVYNASYSHYTDSGEFSITLKFNEPNQKMADLAYVYYLFPAFVTYDSNLKSKESLNRPSIYMTYSGTTDTEFSVDYAFIFEHGYDSQRYFRSDRELDGTPATFTQHAYLVNKLMTYNTIVVDATLIKLEALYTDVIDDKYISDYWHLGLGVEHTLYFDDIDGDLGLIAEYYRYETLQSGKYTDLELFETFQNDLFLGLRYAFNDEDDSSFVGGVIADLEYDEQVYYMEYERRIAESFKLNLDYRYIEPSTTTLSAYALLKRHERLALKMAYYF